MRIVITSAVVMLLAATARSQVQILVDETIPGATPNAYMEAQFELADNVLELQHIQNKIMNESIVMAPGAGRWSIVLRDQDTFGNSLPFDSTTNIPGVLQLDEAVLDPVDGHPTWFKVTWSGTLNWDGTGDVAFSVVVTWGFDQITDPFLSTFIKIKFFGTDLPFYVSEVHFPDLLIENIGHSNGFETLVLPYFTGHLINDPMFLPVVDPELPAFPEFLSAPTLFNVPIGAYYDRESGNCIYLTTNDGGLNWKFNTFTCVPAEPGPGNVGMHSTWIPADLYDPPSPAGTVTYTQPYLIRVGVLEGDWLDVAQVYRTMLATMPGTYYTAPVGSPSNPMPDTARKLVGESFTQPGYAGDNMNALARDIVEMHRVLGAPPTGSGFLSVWYGAYYPDAFEHFYAYGPSSYLPARPSFAAAVREAQAQAGHLVTPYVLPAAAQDVTTQEPIPLPNAFQQAVIDSFTLQENGVYVPDHCDGCGPEGFMRYNCPGAELWKGDGTNPGELESLVSGLIDFTGMGAIYLDAFTTRACYSTEHDHAPGGGTWMYEDRLGTVADIKAAAPADLVVMMEGGQAEFSGEVYLMHHDPVDNKVGTGVCDPDIDPLCQDVQPLAGAVTIPFFKAVMDNVKLGRLGGQSAGSPGKACWIEANNVLTFGLIPHFGSLIVEYFPHFFQRGSRGYNEFLASLVGLLRDEGFLTWHNGTLRRLPALTITGVPNETGGDEPGVIIDGCGVTYSCREPTYYEEWLVPGMFQAPLDLVDLEDAGSLAYVISNPWIEATNALPYSFEIDTKIYPGWDDETVACVEYSLNGGTPTFSTQNVTDPLVLGDMLAPGDYAVWIFRKGVCP